MNSEEIKQSFLEAPHIEEVWYPATGYVGVIKIISQNYRCGYVGVNPYHPLYGVNYTNPQFDILHNAIHGGITYTEDNLPGISLNRLWWIGFDCAHAWDTTRTHDAAGEGGSFWTLDDVILETELLTKLLKAKEIS